MFERLDEIGVVSHHGAFINCLKGGRIPTLTCQNGIRLGNENLLTLFDALSYLVSGSAGMFSLDEGYRRDWAAVRHCLSDVWRTRNHINTY